MFETLNYEIKLDKDQFRAQTEQIAIELNRAQHLCRNEQLGVIVLLEGWDLSGKSSCIQYLTDPLDPRGFHVNVMYPPTLEERRFPFLRRYLIRMPQRGRIGLFLRSWYYHVLDERVQGKLTDADARLRLSTISRTEKALADEGFLLLKFWLQLDETEFRKRRRKMRRQETPRWQVKGGPDDPKQHKHYAEYSLAAEEMIAVTSTDFARWYPIPAHDRRFAQTSVASKIIERINDEIALRRNDNDESARRNKEIETPRIETIPSVLLGVDLTKTIEKKDYDRRLKKAQDVLVECQHECVRQNRSVIFVFEGWDAGGKGGAIKRTTRLLDPRYYEVGSIAAPRGEEADHHYLWRFWKRIPPAGHWSLFDRSWYGRILVERVEGFATVPQWRRAYTEINDFESALVQHGVVLLKFWLHIDKDEQLRRFEERQRVEYKRYKITEEDWRNREKWTQYERAVEDMVQRTSTPAARWFLVPANDKYYARVFILEETVRQISAALQLADEKTPTV